MGNYGFKMRILLARDSIINCKAKSLRLSLPDERGSYILKPADRSLTINKSRDLVIAGKGFSSEKEVWLVAQQIRRSLLLCGVKLRIGIGTKIENLPATSLSFKMPYEVATSQSDFGEIFDKLSPIGIDLSDKQTLALELYNAYHFESSQRTRFITLVFAVETLSDAKKRSEKAQECIKSFQQTVNESDLDVEEKQSLRESLGNLSQESISKTCRDMVESYLGDKKYDGLIAKKFFNECYKMRSDLVHKGRLKDTGRFLEPWIYNLDCLVTDLLLAILVGV
ncbi:MAG: hypothetical protein AB1631_06990 [Acidobacteriota bacterium]